MKTKKKNLVLALVVLFTTINVSNAQLGGLLKKLKKKTKKEKTTKVAEKPRSLNQWHNNHLGKIIFYNKSIEYNSKSSSDSNANQITERIIAGDGPFSFRAYLGKPYKSFEGCDGFDIRYTMGGISVTTEEIIKELPQYYSRMASNYSFYDANNYSVGVALTAGPGSYVNMYTLQEDAFRILLSKIKSKLKVGASLPLKVEIIGTKGNVPTGTVMATGEITMKVTSASNNLQSLNCRCGRPGIKDAKIIKEVKDAFMYQFNGVKKVYKVVLLGRDFKQMYDNSYPVKNVTGKGVWANIVYEKTDGIFMMVKRYVYFKKIGNKFSDKATIGKQKFYLPVSPTCVN